MLYLILIKKLFNINLKKKEKINIFNLSFLKHKKLFLDS